MIDSLKKMHVATLLSLVAFALFSSCSDKNNKEEPEPVNPDEPYLQIDKSSFEFGRYADVQTVAINTNIEEITCKASADWCTLEYANKVLTIRVTSPNTNKNPRTVIATITGGKVNKTITIRQLGRNPDASTIKDDIKLTVKSATASSVQSGEGIEKSFDGDMNTIYHSKWDNSASNYFPITITYNFESVPSMDYLIYYPRTSGTNGNFKKIKLLVAMESNPTLTEYGSYDFEGNPSANRISFVPALEKPVKVQFVVESGVGDSGPGFASCAEMEFYRKNADNFDYLSIFTDPSCSALKSSVTEQTINAIPDAFFKELALDIFKGQYDTQFRVQTYKAWKNPQSLAEKNKTGTLGMRDNPTGIYAGVGDDIIVFMGENKSGQPVSLFIQNVDGNISGSSYSLSTGLNKFKSTTSGLMYIMYYTPTGTEPDVKINFVTGTVNGYFDSQKHTKEDWTSLLNNATFKHFDLIGKYANLTFETSAFKTYTPDGLALIEKYDDMVRLEQDFMGLYKYGKEFKNKSYFLVVYGDNYMYSAGSYTGYNNGTQSEVINVTRLGGGACWGPAHELGHSLQTRPGLRWLGLTEVTNNILSLHVQTSWKNRSRLVDENRYQAAQGNLLNRNVPHNKSTIDVFEKLVPFWQLKLYMHDVLGKADFYKDVYEAVRNQPNTDVSVLTEAYYQLEFVKIVCDVAQLDLTDFFQAWGFLTEIDEQLSDYSTGRFKITTEQIAAVKKYIADKKYSKPKHTNIYDITDENIASFK